LINYYSVHYYPRDKCDHHRRWRLSPIPPRWEGGAVHAKTGRIFGKLCEDVSLNADLTGLMRAIVNEIACGVNGANPTNFRGDVSGLMYILEKPSENVGVNE
jgi:hypothetical protein